MRAVIHSRFGPPEVLSVREVDKPTPNADEVLIRVAATTVTSAEAEMRRGRPLWGRVIAGFLRPRKRMQTLGLEFAGEVHSVGRDVTRFTAGQEVFGFTSFRLGAAAEYLRMPQSGSLAPKPTNTTFEEAAAAVDGPTTALYFLRDKARIRSGHRVLVIGASGSIGTYAVQLARHFGAEVTAVCSTSNVDLVRSLGAHHVVDYTQEDFTRSGETYDIIFDTVGKSSFRRCEGSLTETGCYVSTTGLLNYLWVALTRLRGGKRVLTGMSANKGDALLFVKTLVESGGLQIIIDRRYTLEEIVDAHRHVDSGRKRGNVVVTVRPTPEPSSTPS